MSIENVVFNLQLTGGGFFGMMVLVCLIIILVKASFK